MITDPGKPIREPGQALFDEWAATPSVFDWGNPGIRASISAQIRKLKKEPVVTATATETVLHLALCIKYVVTDDGLDRIEETKWVVTDNALRTDRFQSDDESLPSDMQHRMILIENEVTELLRESV